MVKFYVITKEQADLLTRFEYEPGKVFDPYITDGNGNYYVSNEMYNLLKDTPQFKKIDFTQLQTVNEIPFKNNLI